MDYKLLRVLGKKWTHPILLELEKHHIIRFNQLKNNLGRISSATLSSSLKELQEHGIVKTCLIEEHLTQSYALTDMGSNITKLLSKSLASANSTNVPKVIKLDKKMEQKIRELQKNHFKKTNGESIDFSTVTEKLIKRGLDRASLGKLTAGTAWIAGLAAFCVDHSIEILGFCEFIH